MQRLIKSLLLTACLASCGTATDSRYRDISSLERPPTLPTMPQNYQAGDSYATDDSRIEKRTANTGLASRVYLTDSKPLQLRIKQPIDKAWYTVAAALKQMGIKITDYDRAKKIYYVPYGEANSGLFSFLSETKKVSYLLALKQSGDETVVIATLATEQDSTPEDESDKLLRVLYDMIHDELKPDFNGS